MPFILAGIALIVALIVGAWKLYETVAAHDGMAAGVIAVLVAVAIVVAVVAWRVALYRAIHGRRVAGRPSHFYEMAGTRLTLFVPDRRGTIAQPGAQAEFIFADIAAATATHDADGDAVKLTLRHSTHPDWRIPTRSARLAKRWSHILSLAKAQQL